jgi:ATP-binding cassette subfamily B protein
MKSLSYLNKYFYKYRWRLIFGIVFIALNNYFGAKMPVLVKDATDALFDSSSHAGKPLFQNPVFLIAVTYISFSLISGFFLFLTRQTIIIMSRHIEYDLKNEIYNKYQQLHFGFFKKNRTGDLMNRISEDVSQVRQYLGPGIMYTANLVIMFPLVTYQMIKIDAYLTLFALLPLPIMTILIYFVSSKMNRMSKEVQKEQSHLNTLAQETFSGMRVIKAYLQEQHSNKRFSSSSGEYLKKQMKLVRINALFMPTIMLLIGASSMLSIYVGGTLVLHKELSAGSILAFIGFVYKMTWPFASVGWVTSIIQRASASQSRINEFLQTEPEIITKPHAEKVEFESLKFNHVNFKYRPDLPMALENINFELKKGQVLGIIGRTGSGKSTILQLLLRQVDPSSGTISVNNKPLTDIDLHHFRSSCAVVPQDVFLFSDTIKRNILFGSEVDVTMNEVEQVTKDAHVYHNIVDFPDKFETLLGERGVNLSGGQKQRVSIARALIRKPKILVLDDCLSAVDTETEEIILRNLDKYQSDYNTAMVIVSHRISSIRNADWVLVVEDGKIVEQGTQESLLEKNGLFAEMTLKQSLEEQSES